MAWTGIQVEINSQGQRQLCNTWRPEPDEVSKSLLKQWGRVLAPGEVYPAPPPPPPPPRAPVLRSDDPNVLAHASNLNQDEARLLQEAVAQWAKNQR